MNNPYLTILTSLFLAAAILQTSCAKKSNDILKESESTGTPARNRILVANANEITVAMQIAKSGDTLVMKNKVWNDEKILFKGNGIEGKPIVLIAETPGKVILSGNSSLQISGSHLEVNGLVFRNGFVSNGSVIEFREAGNQSTYCRLTNSVIENYNPTDAAADSKWISLYGDHNRVDHCFFSDKRNTGALLVVWLDGKPNYHQIDHNHFGKRNEMEVNGAEIIRIGTSEWSQTNSFTIVENNYFEECDGEIETISNKSGNNIYRHNTFYKCKGTLTLRHGNHALVEGNFFFGENKSGTGGIRLIGSNHIVINNYLQDLAGSDLRAAISVMNAEPNPQLNGYWQVIDPIISNNTIVNCKQGLTIGSGAGERNRILPPKGGWIYNNIIVSDKDETLVYKNIPENIIYASNLMFGKQPKAPLPDGISFQNPNLIYNEKNDHLWRPAKNNVLIVDNGTPPPGLKIISDMDLQPRDNKIDIGADEISQSSITRPPDKNNTGPEWLKL